MTEIQNTSYRKLLLGTTCGDALLYVLFRGESKFQQCSFAAGSCFELFVTIPVQPATQFYAVPHRDYIACRIGLISILILTMFESKESMPKLDSKRFRSIFKALSTMEVIFTILIPWLIILEGIFNRSQTHKNGHLLASHLFIFQAQIAGECLIEMTGDRRRWLVFPFTCLANAYRGITIGLWIARVMEENAIESRDLIIPAIAGALWIYSSFIFIPREWWPLIK
jgi:hypothetical protein